MLRRFILVSLLLFINGSIYAKLYPRNVAGKQCITKTDLNDAAGQNMALKPYGGMTVRTPNGDPIILFTDASGQGVVFFKYIETIGPDADTLCINHFGKSSSGENDILCNPQDMALMGNNDIYIADAGNNRIYKANLNYSDFKIYPLTPIYTSIGMGRACGVYAYDEGSGNVKIYVADTENNRILKLSSTGEAEINYGVKGEGDGQFNNPVAIARHGNYIYVADMFNNRIVVLYENSNNIVWWSTYTPPTGMSMFTSIDCDKSGNVFIVDKVNCYIYKYTEGLTELLWAVGGLGALQGQYIYPNNIFINKETDDALIVEAWTDDSGLRLLRNRIDILTAQASKTIFEPAKENLTITYKTDDAARMLIRVVTETNDTLKRTLVNNFTFPAGTTSLVWDGKDSLGRLILPGKYKISIQATDGYGNVAIKYVNITVKGTRCPQNLKLHGNWTSENSPYVILGYQTQQYNADSALYINPGTEVMFWPHGSVKYQFVIYDTIKAEGTAEEPILFSSYRKEDERDTSDWRSISLTAKCSTSIFKNCIFEYGGAGAATTNDRSNIHFDGNASPTIENCIIRKSSRYGIYIGGTTNGPIVNNVFSDNAYYPLRLGPDGIGQTHGNIFTNNGIQGIEVNEGTVKHNATWQNQGVPYYAPLAFAVWTSEAGKRCTLTVAAGCSLLFGTVSSGGHALEIGYTYGYNVYKGHFICQGTMLQPVTLAPMVPDTGWQGLTVQSGGSANLQYTTVRGAKRVSQASYSLYCMNALGDTVIAQHCNFEDGDSIGINLPGNYGPVILDNCRIAGNRCIGLYSNLTNRNLRISETIFENNGTYPLVIPPKQIDGILSATFTNNGNNVIRVKYGAIDSSVIWRNFNVPYYLEKNCQVGVRSYGTVPVCTLTIAPRCTVLMDSNSYFQAGSTFTNYHGFLLADGEGGEIVFKSVSESNASGLSFEAQSGGYLNKCTFIGGGGSNTSYRSIIRSNTTNFAMRQCRVTGSDSIGLYLNTPPQQIKYCEFAFNPIGVFSAGLNARTIDSSNIWNNKHYGAYCAGTGILKAENCWWGNLSGPYDPSPDTLTGGWFNPGGLGDKVSDLVDYTPWLATPLLFQITSSSNTATAYNNGKRLIYDKADQLHLAYTSTDSIIYQKSLNDGHSWLTPTAFPSGGTLPATVVGTYGQDTVIAWKAELPLAGWTLKTVNKRSEVWDTVETLLETPGGWDQLHYASPPSMVVNASGTHLVLETVESYYKPGISYIWYWELLYGFRPTGETAFSWTTLDSDTGSGSIVEPPTSPTICVDAKDGIHVAWDYEGEIYWKMYDPYNTNWTEKVSLSNSPEVISEEPSLAFYGDAQLVWEEGNDIYHLRGNWSLSPENIKSFSWWLGENISNTPNTPSTQPVYDGNYASWCELLDNGDTEIYLTKYTDLSWQPYENYSNSVSLFSYYPQIAYRQNTESNNVATAWTEGRDPLYSLVLRDTTGPFTPQLSADLGGAVPSLYTIERDGYFVYNSAVAKSINAITVDYDSTALLYYLPSFDKEQKQTVKMNLYQEYPAKADYMYKISVNDITLGVIKVPSGEMIYFEKELPKVISDSGEGILKIENIKGGLVTCDWWELYSYNKTNGNNHRIGGAQSEEITSVTPNYINKLYQNCPNPFSRKTSFNYQIKNQGQVTFKVYNALGQLVNTLVNETKPAGAYQVEWDGKDGCGLKVSSGVYIYRLQTEGFMETKKMVVIK